jgi:excisionase family DNA binding protein
MPKAPSYITDLMRPTETKQKGVKSIVEVCEKHGLLAAGVSPGSDEHGGEMEAAADKDLHLLTVEEASRYLALSRNTLRRWASQGLLRSYRIGAQRHRRFAKEDLDGLLTENPQGQAERNGRPGQDLNAAQAVPDHAPRGRA